MYDAIHTEVVLGVDTKCPFIHQIIDTEAFADYTDYLADLIESDDIIATIKDLITIISFLSCHSPTKIWVSNTNH